MPLYEYACRDCEKEFEALLRANETPLCPSCRSADLQRKLSTFAAHTNGGGASSSEMSSGGACGACGDPRGPGACSLN